MFTKILVPIDVDYPKIAALVYEKAAALAEMCNAEIRLISVMPGFGMPIVASYITDKMRKAAADKLRTAMEAFIADNCTDAVTYTVRTGKHWEEIIKAADKWEADLIIVYHNYRREHNEAFSDSCSQHVAEHAKCSVLRLRHIMAG